ncbi:DUF1049 domain-containing protein [Erythrobacter arachoides]|uniref:DUF1049 domain-containing protein n=1 Tax=Aurantiacibacter arachoides TaxID=1850444 RepID=A0A845A050_9SPHN|nr:LapA family protein [Aurantiacibacter arachoides]MXO92842.1 DUF1049 domain-containing protein [Aurantiacibacter arachoides]GGD54056.1 hypothetical protein GCM10011411_12450 [Aurantiacibacter arachoides]
MQIVRTVIWVLLLVALLLFSIANWDPTVTVRIWQGIVVDTKIPAIVIVSFLIGFVPMWLYFRGSKWRLQRKVASLESAARTAAVTPVAHDSDGDGVPDRADRHPLTPDGPTPYGTVTSTASADGIEGTHPRTPVDRDGDGVRDTAERNPPASTGPASTGPAIGTPGTYRAPGE